MPRDSSPATMLLPSPSAVRTGDSRMSCGARSWRLITGADVPVRREPKKPGGCARRPHRGEDIALLWQALALLFLAQVPRHASLRVVQALPPSALASVAVA